MAKRGVCSIPACGKPHYAHGWCNAHWGRWRRNGDPLGGGTAPGEVQRYFNEVVMTYEGDECLTWPYQRDKKGYARFDKDGRGHLVARIICKEVHGKPPTPKHEAAHSCGKGLSGCVTKGHVSWKTHADNMTDTIRHGTSQRGTKNTFAKLTEAQVLEIRALKGAVSQRKIAAKFGVTGSMICQIHTGKSWGWLSG